MDRWVYTPQGVRKLIRLDKNFPQPVTEINKGKTPVWLISDIEDYERKRPWLWDDEAKRRRIVHAFMRSMGGPS
ncbi:hypothetical protein [Microvirga sp. 2TAF3]|uniref:hypothetical protein n=1 Tax=Microvirga sp. 2TAF3 TaxID=3233014 RepID=UPI003F994D6B